MTKKSKYGVRIQGKCLNPTIFTKYTIEEWDSISFETLNEAYQYMHQIEDDLIRHREHLWQLKGLYLIDSNGHKIELEPTEDGKHLQEITPSHLDLI
jgi:hypothetical protein